MKVKLRDLIEINFLKYTSVNLHLPARVWNPIGASTNHFIVRITPFAAVVLNSKDKAPYFAYIEVLSTDDKNTDEVPPKMLEASLIDEASNINVEREVRGRRSS